MIKETTIVLIVGLVDFVGVLQSGMSDPDWLMAPSVRTTAYAFAAAVLGDLLCALALQPLAGAVEPALIP